MSDEPIWASDEDLSRVRTASNERYNWAEKARLAITRPGEWLLVHPDAPTAAASNVTSGRVRALHRPEFAKWRFSTRVTDVRQVDPDKPYTKRARIWLRAELR